MKKNSYLLLFAILLIFTGCSKEEVKEASQLTINGQKKNVSVGIIEDEGTELDATPPYREYSIELKSSDTYTPENSLVFSIYSTTTDRLQEGTYTYSYDDKAGTFSYPKIKFDHKYDGSGVATSGTVLSSVYLDETANNTIVVSKENGDKVFDITLTYIKNGETFTVSGHFNEAMKAGSVYFF